MKLQRWTPWTFILLVTIAVLAAGACAVPNQLPAITSLTASPGSVAPEGSSTVACVATDPDGDALTYAWAYSGGTMSGVGSTVTWMAPSVEGTYTIGVTVTDGKGGTANDSIEIAVIVGGNQPPAIASLTASPDSVAPGGSSTITCNATDPDGDPLTYDWMYAGGTHSGAGSIITWIAPSVGGTYTINVTVADGRGGTATDDVDVDVVVETGSINVSSTPEGAAIYLDGESTGYSTPYSLTDVPEGSHTVRLALPYWKDHRETVVVNAGETKYINWVLIEAPAQTETIQPDADAGKDSYVYEANTDTNYETLDHVVVATQTSIWDCRSYLQFDLSGLPTTAVVTSAQLGLYYYYDEGSALAGPVGVYRVTSSWSESGITWDNQPTRDATPEDTITVPATATSDFLYWDIIDMAQGWIDGSITNYGVMLRDADESTSEGYKYFRSSDYATAAERPKLVINYYDPAP